MVEERLFDQSPEEAFMFGSFRTLFMFLLAMGLLALGCEDDGGTPTDDDDNTGDDDDDNGDDDDDDNGDDDDFANGGGTLDVSGAPACSPVGSAWHIQHVASQTFIRGVFVSSEAHNCQAYMDWDAAKGSAWTAFDAAWMTAQDARDPVSACNAAMTYYGALQTAEDALRPPGGCSVQIRPVAYDPGEYFPDGEADEDVFVELIYPQSSFYGAIMDALGNCSSWGDWDEWAVFFGTVELEGAATQDVWEAVSGTMVLGEDDGLLTIQTTDMVIEPKDGTGSGTFSADLHVQYCEI